MKRPIVFLTVLLLSGWSTVSAQSLAELAKKEKERRKKNDVSQVKSFDESDLRSRGGPLPTSVSPPQVPSEPDEPGLEEDAELAGEEVMGEEVTGEEVTEEAVEPIEEGMEPIGEEGVEPSEPAAPVEPPPNARNPAAQEPEEKEQEEDPTRTEAYWRNRLAPVDKRIGEIRAQLNAPGFAQDPRNMLRRQRLERDLEQALSDRQVILDEARRKGVPPGWLR